MAGKDVPKKKGKVPSSMGMSTKTMIAGLIIIGLAISVFAAFYASSGNQGSTASVPAQDCAGTAIAYLNSNIAQAGTSAEFISVTDRNGVYAIAARYQGRNVTLYATRDCNYLFTSSYNMKTATTPTPATSPTPTPPVEPVKSDRPATELFVMSFCPYGVQAETAMEPVVELLGEKADIRVRYIATLQGETLDTIKALHGPVEAKENLRQLCIAKYSPEKLWPYLLEFNANCYSLRQNTSAMETCLAAATAKTGIDNRKIETCATGSEGMELMKGDETITKSLKITGSPTLLINGQKYSGQRTPEAYKQAICARFTTPPAECGTNLSVQAAAATGSCG